MDIFASVGGQDIRLKDLQEGFKQLRDCGVRDGDLSLTQYIHRHIMRGK